MQLKFFLISVLASLASTQSLLEALASQNASLSTLIGLIQSQPDLVTSLSNATNVTLLAPNNNAIGNLSATADGAAAVSTPGFIQALLQYHVINGAYPGSSFTSTPVFVPTLLTNRSYTTVTGGQRVGVVTSGGNVVVLSGLKRNSTVTQADIKFTGGVIHIIDSVLTIPQTDRITAQALNLTSLAGAVANASLGPALDTINDITIFSPNNAAFAAIGSAASTLSADALGNILKYHVLNGTVGYSSTLSNSQSIATLEGHNVTIRVANGNVFVNSAKVVVADVLVNHGVFHVIDNVLNPNASNATPIPTASTQSVAFPGATSVSNVPFTSGISASSTGRVASTSATAGANHPMQTGVVGAAALFGGAAVLMAGL